MIMAGAVLGEQTQLTFSPAPPVSSCSPTLPAFVCEGRGGETGFAMNQQTQLQFNLKNPLDQHNVATKFEPRRPSPVVIERRLANTTTGKNATSNFKRASADKLSLASTLAKREAKRMTLVIDPPPSTSYDQCSCCKECDDECGQILSDGERSSCIETLSQHLKDVNVKKNKTSKAERKHRLSVPVPAQVAIVKEIEKLKVDLTKQLEKMNKPKQVKDDDNDEVRIYREPVHWNEEEESEARQIQRQGEQMVRNNRMMYDLSQLVCRSLGSQVIHSRFLFSNRSRVCSRTVNVNHRYVVS